MYKPPSMNRRQLLCASAATAAMGTTLMTDSVTQGALSSTMSEKSVRYCLNMSTIQGEKIDVQEQIQIAAKAGYTGVELWLRDIQRYLDAGGKLETLRKQIDDAGLTVESAIAFGQWLVDDDAAREKGLADCGRDMETIRALGGRRIAAPPTGMTKAPPMDLDRAGERYYALLEIGKARECIPQIEVWGHSTNCYSLKQVLYICAAASHPDACILPDVYHLYKGGSDFDDIAMLAGKRVHAFHMNDYPVSPTRPEIKDEHRVYPGDGIAPMRHILRTMLENGFTGALSLELFNRNYWAQDPNVVAATGLAKMKAAVVDAVE
jgi:2-keto-myo-inositol isomerase